MRIGLSYDLKEAIPPGQDNTEDALEEYDSPETVRLITAALKSMGHEVIPLGGGSEFLDNVRRQSVDMVFNIAEGRGNYRSREAQVPSVLEMLDIPYTGSDPQCLTICLDKPLSKQLVTAAGVRTPGWRVIKDSQSLWAMPWDDLTFPVIVKPAYEGSSKGIRLNSLAENPRQASQVAQAMLEHYHQPAMVEDYIGGDEVTVGLTGNNPRAVLGMMRVLPRKQDKYFVYSLEVKRDWKNLVDYECPARLKDEVLEQIRAASITAFEALGCRDFARIDFRISPEGVPYFIEINPLPGLGDYSDLVIMAIKLGWSYQALIAAILGAARERYPLWVSR